MLFLAQSIKSEIKFMQVFWRLACVLAIITAPQQKLFAQEIRSAYRDLIPHCVLGLVHAPEVHKELKLSDKQVEDLEVLLRKVDAQWFPARILPADKQHDTILELESQVWDWFGKSASAAQRQRLQQLELQAQGNRALLRSDIAKQADLQSAQQQKLVVLARATDETKRALAQALFGDEQLKNMQLKAEKAAKAERDGLVKLVRPDQRQKLKPLLGDAFDVSRLKRIYAMAPEFAAEEHWINSSPLTMRELRGKVVLVHFYAFQCHNCHANFEIYRRWHKELSDKGVVVIGIQTPETKRERDPDAVKTASRERELKFPILIDLDSENWKAWGNTMWPCVYVVDKQGYIRVWWQGELNWKGATGDETIEKAVETLLAEK